MCEILPTLGVVTTRQFSSNVCSSLLAKWRVHASPCGCDKLVCMLVVSIWAFHQLCFQTGDCVHWWKTQQRNCPWSCSHLAALYMGGGTGNLAVCASWEFHESGWPPQVGVGALLISIQNIRLKLNTTDLDCSKWHGLENENKTTEPKKGAFCLSRSCDWPVRDDQLITDYRGYWSVTVFPTNIHKRVLFCEVWSLVFFRVVCSASFVYAGLLVQRLCCIIYLCVPLFLFRRGNGAFDWCHRFSPLAAVRGVFFFVLGWETQAMICVQHKHFYIHSFFYIISCVLSDTLAQLSQPCPCFLAQIEGKMIWP